MLWSVGDLAGAPPSAPYKDGPDPPPAATPHLSQEAFRALSGHSPEGEGCSLHQARGQTSSCRPAALLPLQTLRLSPRPRSSFSGPRAEHSLSEALVDDHVTRTLSAFFNEVKIIPSDGRKATAASSPWSIVSLQAGPWTLPSAVDSGRALHAPSVLKRGWYHDITVTYSPGLGARRVATCQGTQVSVCRGAA